MDRDSYEKDLRTRQKEHLRKVRGGQNWEPCFHDSCPQCHGTGIKLDGTSCLHMIFCQCPKCNHYHTTSNVRFSSNENDKQ